MMDGRKALAIGVFAIAVSGCGGGGGGSQTSPNLTPGSSAGSNTAAGVAKHAATFSVAIPMPKAAGQSSSSRSVKFVSPSTNFFYIDLQDSPGHGDPAYAYTETVDATHCQSGGATMYCTFSEQEPIGTDTFSVAAGGAGNWPLSYSGNQNGAEVTTVISPSGQNIVSMFLAPIITTAVVQSVFVNLSPYSQPNAGASPYLSVVPEDEAGDAMMTSSSPPTPFVNPVMISDTNAFVAWTVDIENVATAAAAATSATLGTPLNFYLALVNATQTSTITVTVPQVILTQVEFPQLESATWFTNGSVETYTATCAPSLPTVNPCNLGTGPANFSIQ